MDYVASLLPDVQVLGLTDAMFSEEQPNAAGVTPSYLNNMMDFGYTVRVGHVVSQFVITWSFLNSRIDFAARLGILRPP